MSAAMFAHIIVVGFFASAAFGLSGQNAAHAPDDIVTKPVDPISVPIEPAPAPAATPIIVRFSSRTAFDNDLNVQLNKANDRNVEVEFYSPVSPNAIPRRIGRRLAALRKEGGSVRLVPPQNATDMGTVMATEDLRLFRKTFKAASNERAMVASVKDRDVDLVLDRTVRGRVILRKLVFKKRPPAPPAAAPSTTG